MLDPNHGTKVLGLIPARGGSKGIPGKNIKMLGDLPLIAHTCRAAFESCVDRVVVSTDCVRIAEVARRYDVEVPFIRPALLAADDTPTLEVIKHTLTHLADAGQELPELVVLLQPTSPFRIASDIDECVRKLQDSNADSIVTICETPQHFNAHWQFHVEEDGLRITTGEPLENIVSRRQLLPPTYIRNGAVYCFRVSAFLHSNSIYGARCLGHVMPQSRSINLDTLEDWQAAEQFITSQTEETQHAA